MTSLRLTPARSSGQNSGTLTASANTLATGETIAAGAAHTYNLSFVVTLDLTDGTGDDMYSVCDGTTPLAGQGLFNAATLTSNGQSITEDACGDLPALDITKTFVSAVSNGDGTFTVNFTVSVANSGGAAGTYDLSDTPGFDDDVVINSGTFSSTTPPNLSGTLMAGTNTLATAASIAVGATHTYNLSFNVTLDLTAGNGSYTACDGTTPVVGQGLFNTASLISNGITQEADDCGDLPTLVTLDKTFVAATPNGDGTYTVTYTVEVTNSGGAASTYDLSDTPGFDDDVTINSGMFSSTNPPNLSGTLTAGTNTLATAASIAAGATHTYTLSFATLDLTDGSGDNMYSVCDGTSPTSGEGLYNAATLISDGITQEADDCGDLPVLDITKTFGSATPNGDGTFTVNYTVSVANSGGAAGTYDLSDNPGFDDDVTINSGMFSGQASGPLNTSGSTTLATSESIAAGATHTYNLSFNVTLDLTDGTGDDSYTACDGTTPLAGQGLFNEATLTSNGQSITDEACGDLPALDITKNFVSATPNNDGTFTVNYTVTVENTGGATGTYGLEDTPGFDDDVTINSGMFSGQASGPLNTSGSTTLATSESIAAGATHTYNLSFNVTLDLTDGSGDDMYSVCDGTSPMSGEGLFNQASLSTNGTTLEAEDCGDIPALVIAKTFDSAAPNNDGTFTVNYTVTVENTGGATGTYGLEDTPGFDDDITINSGTFSGQASGPLNATSGSTTLASGASIIAGATHTYNLSFNVTLDLTGW